MSEAPDFEHSLATHQAEQPTTARRTGLSTMTQGAGFAALGIAGLWVSFRLAGNARALLGAGPLIGGGMVGYGATQAVLGDRLAALRWVVAVVSGFCILGATVLVLETTLGVAFS